MVWSGRTAPQASAHLLPDQVRKLGKNIFSTKGLAIVLVIISLVGLLLGSRAIVKSFFSRVRRKG